MPDFAKEDLCFTIYDPIGTPYGYIRVASRGGTGSGERIKQMLNGCLMDDFTVILITEVPSRFSLPPNEGDKPNGG